jgi:methylated-DNA-[protein]-cysteine S-methyltransferase
MHGTPSSTTADFDTVIDLPFGPFGIRTAGGSISELVFLPPGTPVKPPASETGRVATAALQRWIEAPDQPFPLPLLECGTAFQRRVWAEIRAIPAGQTRSYGQLSARLGSAARAVGQACGANPYPLVVPCHRVTSASGLGGFANARGGWLLDVKRWLLRHEGAA